MSLQPAYSEAAAAGDQGAVRVMIVDDSAVARGLISRWVDEDPALMMVGKAANGLLAVQNAAKYEPDLIILDIEMPVMDGMTALPELLARNPGVKVIMASTLSRRNAEISLRALSLGAVDYVPKPESNSGITTSSTFREELIGKIRAVCGVAEEAHAPSPARVREARSAPPPLPAMRPGEPPQLLPFSSSRPRLLAIGASTGGPKALIALFARIAPVIGSIPVVIAQHMPPTFTTILAEHLARETGVFSKEGVDGEPLRAGAVYVAPGGMHMTLARREGRVALKVYDGPQVNYCKPAVDPLFHSAAETFGRSTLALMLTGMGHDGALGAVGIARAGGSVIAQDQASSVVWGMPKSALRAGACAGVMSIEGMADKISGLLKQGIAG